ncbi:serine carboxypeptidase-like 18 [Papaver somniferum]|uniref:serine carboxypeptidase-like 18 n=1 Tax=Papaver somniferum TaxID=3469 RepID=UPI000E6FA1DE|nr:serine carboxypeptidase-like 18 [Papaver somniferum]
MELNALSCGKLVTYLPGLEVQPLPFQPETGYIGVGSGSESSTYEGDSVHELFYYFVKSERNPKEDPLVLWLAGGPFCSGLSNLATGIGPIRIDKVVEYNNCSLPTLTLNPNSWAKVANIIFLDAPMGAGFSYSKSSRESPISDSVSAKHTHEFLVKWLIQNPEFQSNPVYIAGISKSGFLIPIIVQDLIRDTEDGKYPFLNFKVKTSSFSFF